MAVAYREVPPPPALAAHLECLWMVWDDRRRARREPERIVPDACPEIIVHLGDVFARRIGARWVRQPRAFLAGTLSRPWILRAGARLDTLGIRFRPGAVRGLFPVDMARATDRELPLVELAGPTAGRLVRALGETHRRRRVDLVARWLADRRSAAPDRPGRELLDQALKLLRRSRGRLRIEALAARLGAHPRRLERLFRRELGIRPKLFARIVRLHAVLARVQAAERDRTIDLALDAGYFDQSHLLRDFARVAGRSPRAPAAGDGAMARHFTRPERVLAWLAGE